MLKLNPSGVVQLQSRTFTSISVLDNKSIQTLLIVLLILSLLTLCIPPINFFQSDTVPYIIKELTEKRTLNSEHFLMSDGSVKANIYTDNIFLKIVSGT